MRDTIDRYESLLQRALHGTFKHPKMLLLGALVASVNTGSVFFHLYQFSTVIAPFDSLPIDVFSTLPTIAWIGTSNLFQNTSITATAITIVLSILLFLVGTMAQKWLIEQSYSAKKIKTRLSKAQFGLNSTWIHLLYINALYIIGTILTFGIGGSILSMIPQIYPIAYSMGSVAIYLILITFVFLWNVTVLLALMHVAQEGAPTLKALQEAFTHVIKHPLQVMEISLLQLATELLLTIIGIFILASGVVGAGLIMSLFSEVNNTFIIQTGLIFMGSAIAFGLIVFAGLITSFSYHLWAEYHKEQYTVGIKSIFLHLGQEIRSLIKRTHE